MNLSGTFLKAAARAACVLAAASALGCAGGLAKAGRAPVIGDMLSARTDGWNRPVRLTRGIGARFNADYHPGTGRLAYVSDRDGGADIFLRDGFGGAAVKATDHPARDRWPRIAPDGKRVLFVSTRLDGAGDLWVLPPARWLRRREPQRLTGSETPDDQPCWHPDGRSIFYAATWRLGERFDLWMLPPDGEPERLTYAGGQMPGCSPDGRHLVFVSSRAAGDPDLWLLRLADRAMTPLTAGTPLDFHPCWSDDGRRIYFARVCVDSDGDGRLGRGDVSSIFSVAFSPAQFDGGDMPAVRQLTSFAVSESHPRPLPGGFLFSRTLGDGNTEVMALGGSGEMPRLAAAGDLLGFARRVERDEPEHVFARLLAWQNVLWASRTAGNDALRPEKTALAWLQTGRAWLELGRRQDARGAFTALSDEFPSARGCIAQARLELLRLARLDLEGSGATREEWEGHLSDLAALDADCRPRAAQGGEDAAAFPRTAAGALLETGHSHLAAGKPEEALRDFDAVMADGPARRQAGASALLGKAAVYRALDWQEALVRTCLDVIERYAEQPDRVAQAAALAVQAIAGPAESDEQRLSGLRGVIEQHPEVPILCATAQNAIGDLRYARRDYRSALAEYRRSIAAHPAAGPQVAAAHLAIALIHTEQQDYRRAVEVFAQARNLLRGKGGHLYERAARGYVNSLLLKARREIDLGDPALALNTYGEVLSFDGTLAAGYRGAVECHSLLGRLGEAVLRYRPRVREDEGDHLARYGLALAYSYYGPTDWVGDKGATRRRAAIDRKAVSLVEEAILLQPDEPYYRQIHGFLRNRLALATGRSEHELRALDAYMAALALSSPELAPANYPNLLFNVGEGYMLVGRPQLAYRYYRKAVDAGFPLEGARGRAARGKIGRAATAAGDYEWAATMLEDRLRSPEDPAHGAGALRRRAEALDQLALVRRLAGDYSLAVQAGRRYVEALERLVAEDPERADSYRRNHLRARRNLAISLCNASDAAQSGRDALVEAYDLFTGVLTDLDTVGVVRGKEARGAGLFTINVAVAPGGTAGFDPAAEKRLACAYLARISAALGDHVAALDYLKRKLMLYPELAAGAPAGALTERAIVWGQIGQAHADRGAARIARKCFQKTLELERRAGNLEGELYAVLSLGALGLRRPERRRSDPDWQAFAVRVIAMHRDVLTRLREQEGDCLIVGEAALSAQLAALLDAAATAGGVEQ